MTEALDSKGVVQRYVAAAQAGDEKALRQPLRAGRDVDAGGSVADLRRLARARQRSWTSSSPPPCPTTSRARSASRSPG